LGHLDESRKRRRREKTGTSPQGERIRKTNAITKKKQATSSGQEVDYQPLPRKKSLSLKVESQTGKLAGKEK